MIWSCHVWRHQFQICEVMEVEITGKRKNGRPRKSWEECVKKDLERYGLRREDAYERKWREEIKAKICQPQPAEIIALKRTLLLLYCSSCRNRPSKFCYKQV